jgi:TolA-binding protein
MLPHEHFEELCALAVSGDIREDEWTELNEHLQGCADCRKAARGFEDICLILTEAAESGGGGPVPEGMTERFIARARSAGIRLDPKVSSPGRGATVGEPFAGAVSRNVVFWAAAAMIVLAMISFFAGVRYGSRGQRSISKGTPPLQEPAAVIKTTRDVSVENQQLRDQLRDAQEQAATLSGRLWQEQQALESAKQEKTALTSRVAEFEQSTARLRDNESQRNAEIAQLKEGLERVRSQENANRTASLLSEAELKKVRNEVAKLSFQLSQAQELNAAVNEARDLIVARNLHVLDVRDADEDGKPQRAFGRIFYTEGRKLEFYAYDLTDSSKFSAKASFYVWGETAGAIQRVVSLGKLRVDSEQEGRWVLKVTDPRVLAQISSVFVTVESDNKAVNQPSGRRMLSRFLGTTANHL